MVKSREIAKDMLLKSLNAHLGMDERFVETRVQDLLREFGDDRQFSAAKWLLDGLHIMERDGSGFYLNLLSSDARRNPTRAALREALTRQLVENAELVHDDPNDGYSEEQVSAVQAWLEQPDFVVWLRVRVVKNKLLELVRDHLFEYARGEGPDVSDKGEECWSELVSWWHKDRQKGTDRVLEGRVS